MNLYPTDPTARAGSPKTAFDAAEVASRSAPKMAERVERYLSMFGPASAEQVTAAIALPGERILLNSVRARLSQCRAQGRVTDSGERGIGESLRTKVVKWRLTTPAERSSFAARKAGEDEKGPDRD